MAGGRGVAMPMRKRQRAAAVQDAVAMCGRRGFGRLFSGVFAYQCLFSAKAAGEAPGMWPDDGTKATVPSPSVGFLRLPSPSVASRHKFFSREREMGRMGLIGRMCRIRREGASNCTRGRRPSRRVAARLKTIKHVHSAQNKSQTFICHDFRSKRREQPCMSILRLCLYLARPCTTAEVEILMWKVEKVSPCVAKCRLLSPCVASRHEIFLREECQGVAAATPYQVSRFLSPNGGEGKRGQSLTKWGITGSRSIFSTAQN
jgi:hypothetical protein